MSNVTYRQIRDKLSKLTDEQLDAPGRVVELSRCPGQDGIVSIGDDFPIQGVGIDMDDKPYFEMPFVGRRARRIQMLIALNQGAQWITEYVEVPGDTPEVELEQAGRQAVMKLEYDSEVAGALLYNSNPG